MLLYDYNMMHSSDRLRSQNGETGMLGSNVINNGNRTEWSPTLSVIIRVIDKIGRPGSESPIC